MVYRRNTGFSVWPEDSANILRNICLRIYAQYTATYSGSNYTDIWAAVDTICNLFNTLTLKVATHLTSLPQEEEDGMREYLRMVKDHVL